MSYESDIASGAFVPSDRAKEVDALIAASTPETEPENWRFLGTVGWIYVGPLGKESSRSEYTAWVNRNLGAFTDIYENPNAGSTSSGSSGGLNYMTQAELDAYNQANGTNFSGNYLSTHPNTGEPGMWTWDPMAGWRDDTQWVTTTTGPNFSGNNPNAPADPPRQIIGWYWDGSAWQPIYQGESAPPNTVVAPTSTKPTQPPQTNNGGGNNNNGGGDNSTAPVPIGWYWSGSAWLPFYQGEAPPAGLPQGWVAPTSTMPSNPPQGTNTGGTNTDGTNTDGTNTDGTNTGGTNPEPEPEPPPLFTPDGSMFFQGLFNASDLLYRDGSTVTSPYYNNARQNILDQLSLQAASNGRTQNTAEEIQMAQNQTPSLSATGLFNPDYYALLKGMGVG